MISLQICNLKNWTPVAFHVFSRDNIHKAFTVMHKPVFEHLVTLSFALLAFIILYINGKQFRCSVFTFVQYILSSRFEKCINSNAS